MTLQNLARNLIYGLLSRLTGPGRGVRVILMYHSVGVNALNSVRRTDYEAQMEMLVERFTTARVSDLFRASPRDADNVVCVTFDDGYLDNYEVALPVLEQLGIKATFFVATGFLNGRMPTSVGEVPMMTSDHVRELANLGHEIGAHTKSHLRLTTIPLEAARREVAMSKEYLESLLGREVVSFAYPRGAFDEQVKTLVDSLGFRVAVTTREGLVGSDPDWLALPRVWISRTLSAGAFKAKTSPAVEWYARFRALGQRASGLVGGGQSVRR